VQRLVLAFESFTRWCSTIAMPSRFPLSRPCFKTQVNKVCGVQPIRLDPLKKDAPSKSGTVQTDRLAPRQGRQQLRSAEMTKGTAGLS
jgi:hypothetical protein